MTASGVEGDPFIDPTRTAERLTLRLNPGHALAACEGHFPGDLLIPGSTLVGLAGLVAGRCFSDPERWRLQRVDRATFAAPARPTQAIDFTARQPSPGTMIVDIRGDGRQLATAHLHFERLR